ncbi:MAG: carbohydrate ABC transporter permease [Actinomycetota bacterium]|nr:carbohydrate ABC transporter permease [Actinomycetota bacterium]
MRSSTLARIPRAVAILALLAWSLGPVLIGIVTSLSTQSDVQAIPTRWLPHHWTLDGYTSLVSGTSSASAGGSVSEAGTFSTAMFNSAIITALATLGTLMVAIPAAYSFSRLRFSFDKPVLWGILATMIVPVFTVVISLYRLMADLGLIDTKLGLTLVFISTLTPLATWLLYNHIRELPVEPEEAALIDGCNRWKAFYRVVVPQMRSGIAAISAILMLSVWGEFLIPLLLTSTLSAKPATVLITEYIGKYTTNYPLLAAAGVLILIPPALVALVLNRHIRGMLSGTS